MPEVYRYSFRDDCKSIDIERCLALAFRGAESLHGEAEVRMDGQYAFDPGKHLCVIDSTTPVGRDINRLFVGFLQSEMGEASFRIDRRPKNP